MMFLEHYSTGSTFSQISAELSSLVPSQETEPHHQNDENLAAWNRHLTYSK